MTTKANPILDATLLALGGMTGGAGAKPVISDSALPQGAQRRAPKGHAGHASGLVTDTFRASGFLDTDTQPAGSALNPQAQLGLFKKIRKQHGWARFVSYRTVSENTGYLDVWDDQGFQMHPTARSGPRTGIPVHAPDLDNLQYTTSTLSGAFGIRLKAVKSAVNAGQNVNSLVQQGIAAGVANVLLDIGINGDNSLPKDSDRNTMLSTADGWFQKMRDKATNYTSLADGFSYHNGIFPGMLDQIDEAYRGDKGLAWGLPDKLSTRWLTELTEMNQGGNQPARINDFGSALLNAMGGEANPLGKPGVVMSQIKTDRYGTEGYAGMAPTSVVDNGDGTITINVNTLATSGVDRSSAGADGQRYVTVGKVGGTEETLAVAYSAPNNTVTTASLLGQVLGSVSTTASDYYVKWADLTSAFLGVMRYLTLIVQNGIRIYTVFHPRDEIIEVIVHADVDYMVIDHQATSLVDDIIAPRFAILP
jgi:hypothetical protein